MLHEFLKVNHAFVIPWNSLLNVMADTPGFIPQFYVRFNVDIQFCRGITPLLPPVSITPRGGHMRLNDSCKC